MDLYPLFDWLQLTTIGAGIRKSTWLFPAIEAVHLLGFAVLGGAVLLLDLRLLGIGLTAQAPSAIERNTRPWLIGSAAAMIATGGLLFLSEAIKLYGKDAFWVKIAALAGALVFTFTVHNPVARRDPAGGVTSKAIAVVSIALWFTVAVAGRWIGFS